MMQYEVDHEFLQTLKEQMEEATEELRQKLLTRQGLPKPLIEAVVQKMTDLHRSRHMYFETREQQRAWDSQLRMQAVAAGVHLQNPPADQLYKFDQSYIDEKINCMEQCTENIVLWMHSINIDPYVRMEIHQLINDVDYGRREELRLIEDLKRTRSILKCWEQALL